MLGFSIKAVIAAMCVFVTNYKWLSVCLSTMALLLVFEYLRWVSSRQGPARRCRVHGASLCG